MGQFIDLTGQRFGRLTVIKRVGSDKNHYALWECQCDCGNTTVTSSNHLLHNNTKSCGCFKRELSSNRFKKHGEYKTRLYRIWRNIMSRCIWHIKEDHRICRDYQHRGITVCNEWQEYENFAKWARSNGYSDDLSIDRIDVNGNYEPNNCRWADIKTQANNKRSCIYIKINNEVKTLTEWCEQFGVNKNTAHARIFRLGWDPQKAVSTPARKRNNKKEVS